MPSKRKACLLFAGFLYFFSCHLLGQDQRIADSLFTIYQADSLEGVDKLELLRSLSFNESADYQKALEYAEELINLSKPVGNYFYLSQGYFHRGNVKRLLGDLEEALRAFFTSSEIAKRENLISLEGSSYGAIADIYAISDNFTSAKLYYDKAIATLEDSEYKIALASMILNAGDALLNNSQYDSALVYFNRSGTLFNEVDYPIGKAYNLGNIGMVYANLGQTDVAEENIRAAIQILEESGDYYPISVYLISMSDIYHRKNRYDIALQYAQRSLEIAQQYRLKDQISSANLKLSELHEDLNNLDASLKYFRDHIAYRDSVNNIQSVQAMADLRTKYEVSQKQIEVDLLEEQKENQRNLLISLVIILSLLTILIVTLIRYYRINARERKRSETLLLNILPAVIAEELKQKGKVDAVKFDQVTVLFTDFVQFTEFAEQINPSKLVKSIDYYFRGFDEITTKYGLEKIKTIGDSYMCACGLPSENPSHAKNVVLAAAEMIDLVNRQLPLKEDLQHFEIRIGVHTGPVIAGIVGIKKWQYDIWGDTVNIASRMESSAEPGRINLSETTYQEIKDQFTCQFRGELEVKNHRPIRMYFLEKMK